MKCYQMFAYVQNEMFFEWFCRCELPFNNHRFYDSITWLWWTLYDLIHLRKILITSGFDLKAVLEKR